MSTLPEPTGRRYSVEEYFEFERNSQEKFEYRDGQVVNLSEVLAMAGGSINHSLVIANVVRELGNRLKGGSCKVFQGDLRVRVPRKLLYAYPDVTVICGTVERDVERGAGETATNPRIVVEVLSPGTEAYDRGGKFFRYREIPSFQQYVLVSQDEARVETFFRQEDGVWVLDWAEGIGSTAKLRSLKVEIPLAEIYAGVEFPAPAATPSA